MHKLKTYLIRGLFLSMTAVILVLALLLSSKSNRLHYVEKLVKQMEQEGQQKDQQLEMQRKAFAAVTRQNWYYVETDTNNFAWVSTEPSFKGENKGEKLSFPLPAGYMAWLHTPIPSESVPSDRVPVGYAGDGLAGSKVKFIPSHGTNSAKSTYDGLVLVEFSSPRSNLLSQK